MAQMIISDHTIWLKHIDSEHIAGRIAGLKQNAAIALRVDGRPVLFRKMRDGGDGRPTPGIRPDEAFKDYWNRLYRERRGEAVEIELDDTPPTDPYLAAVSELMTEWTSKADADAYDDL
ncbi:hypothetical protein [Bosea sp. (in: a-proteobacteria)]|uniref:hypothetical protein n=1 Tax=Bosea sp. (in: a-proteobacteria) TaxID=1871050 RepID=UPI002B49CCE8|nr:hypothetical protein [Bosea sp. (in: a-proteobacteria)]WRH60204.1 MAG: hypothetical protein RSE11_10670 [Bosea sp. (in: a-proteobacteria)]